MAIVSLTGQMGITNQRVVKHIGQSARKATYSPLFALPDSSSHRLLWLFDNHPQHDRGRRRQTVPDTS